MIEQQPRQTKEFLPIDADVERALGQYARTLSDFRDAEALIAAANETIERINQGLPEGHMVGTRSSWSPEVRRGQGGFNKIYRPDQSGQYCVVGEICTTGAQKPFLGDRLIRDGDELVVINDGLKLGFSVKGEVFVINTANDPTKRTLGGSHLEQFENVLLPLIQKVPQGETVAADFLYY